MQLQSREDCATCVVAQILDSYIQLSRLSSLYPSPCVNGLFEKLIDVCCNTLDKSIIDKASFDVCIRRYLQLNLTTRPRSWYTLAYLGLLHLCDEFVRMESTSLRRIGQRR